MNYKEQAELDGEEKTEEINFEIDKPRSSIDLIKSEISNVSPVLNSDKFESPVIIQPFSEEDLKQATDSHLLALNTDGKGTVESDSVGAFSNQDNNDGNVTPTPGPGASQILPIFCDNDNVGRDINSGPSPPFLTETELTSSAAPDCCNSGTTPAAGESDPLEPNVLERRSESSTETPSPVNDDKTAQGRDSGSENQENNTPSTSTPPSPHTSAVKSEPAPKPRFKIPLKTVALLFDRCEVRLQRCDEVKVRNFVRVKTQLGPKSKTKEVWKQVKKPEKKKIGPLSRRGKSNSERKSNSEKKSNSERKNAKGPITTVRHRCARCGNYYTSTEEYLAHLRSHGVNINKWKYNCKVCGKLCPNTQSLKIHMRTHTGEKPYVCRQCGHRFITTSNLRSHERIHTGETPWSCKRCGKRFAHSANYKYHIARSECAT